MADSTLNVMAPLLVGDPNNLQCEASRKAFDHFDRTLAQMKSMGVQGVSTDVWWRLVEPRKGQYDFSFYRKVASHIVKAGLRWVPIISIHQCGGNVGDDVNVPLPDWVWTYLQSKVANSRVNAFQYVSEQGNSSPEYVSIWATDLILEEYKALFRAFQTEFADLARSISEVNISLGPAGELRLPSYNSHDRGTGWPYRGALQLYSSLARESWRKYALDLYGNEAGIKAAWGHKSVEPPRWVWCFFRTRRHISTQYGRDLFDWQQKCLLDHGRMVLLAGLDTYSVPGAPFAGIDIGAKVPGIHWRCGTRDGAGRAHISDRLAELPAGLIRTSDQADWHSDDAGRGYRPLLSLFKELQPRAHASRLVLHFTCLEMADGDGPKRARSLAGSLVRWVGEEAKRQGIPLKGENALGYRLPDEQSWKRMSAVLRTLSQEGLYHGLTLLRMTDIAASDVAQRELKKLAALIGSGS